MFSPREQLIAAKNTTSQMLQAAHDEQWARIAELEVLRSQQLSSLFPLGEQAVETDFATELEALIELNQQVENLCREARQSLQSELSQFTRNKRAAAAYRSA
jgi:hypothetical protein